jgi:3'(2'), 5'-bisphosphate nucleotidase
MNFELLPLPDSAALLLCARVAALCEAAGRDILSIYAGEVTADYKDDGSPLTAADRASHEVLVAGLPQLDGGYAVVSEEAAEAEQAAVDRGVGAAPYWLIDPLDGTKEFLSRNGQFTVNVALIWRGRPVLGVVHVPATGDTYAGVVGVGATWLGAPRLGLARGLRALQVRPVPAAGLTVVGSRSHGDAAALEAFLEGHRVAALSSAGSSLKFCLLARGEADLYPRLGRTMIWDTAAGQAVLTAAGGAVRRLDGTPLDCAGAALDNPHFVAQGAREAWAPR